MANDSEGNTGTHLSGMCIYGSSLIKLQEEAPYPWSDKKFVDSELQVGEDS